LINMTYFKCEIDMKINITHKTKLIGTLSLSLHPLVYKKYLAK
jgi:hypothetical protein